MSINVKLLHRIQKFILKEKDRFDMSDWLQPIREGHYSSQTKACGTACCIAGAAYVIQKGFDLTESRAYYDLPAASEVVETAVNALGLNLSEKNRLFYSSGWPAKYRVAYRKAKTSTGRARVGVNRISHFIKTKGEE